MTLLRAGVGGVGVGGLKRVRRGGGAGDEVTAAMLGSTLETFRLDGEVRVGYVL